LAAIQWKVVISAPSLYLTDACQQNSDRSIKNNKHGFTNGLVTAEVPDADISGVSVEERLQSISIKALLFCEHIHQVKHYHRKKWGHIESVGELLNHVTERCRHFATNVQRLLKVFEPHALVPTPAPLMLEHKTRYKIKVYSWAVQLRLKEWLTLVKQVFHTVNCTGHN
uniref:Ciliary neurotrophic factor n=1 Tax=Neogobius melanostomus TaxID=47308 RepID=A0A8C6U0B0_9GOBI